MQYHVQAHSAGSRIAKGEPWRAHGARVYNGGLGREPHAGAKHFERFLSVFIQKKG